MKFIIHVLLLLITYGAFGGQPIARPDTTRLPATTTQEISRWLADFQQTINQLSGQADTSLARDQQASLLDRFFVADTVHLPGLLRIGLPVNRAADWLTRMKAAFWERNFRFDIDQRTRSIQVVSSNRHSVQLQVLVPVTLFGIYIASRKPVQYRGQWRMTLRVDKHKDKLTNFRIQSVEAKKWGDEPSGLTLDMVSHYHQQLEASLLQVLGGGPNQTEALSRIRQLIPQDTLLLRTDHRTDTLVISQLGASVQQRSGWNLYRIASFDLHFCTDFLRTADGHYTGRLTVLEGVTASLATPQLYKSQRTDVVPVDPEIAQNSSYRATLSNVVLTNEPK
ncbi:hypothetical protein [Spirosoma fluviale]|uniref:Uncharacterized protein n=1 Tax=Spirosoma fluviale TaxID=1597977 RepID=A0A286GW12_9BACT|nr:hypothetical protein [Spirosoma fluviale]SOD99728.1 hypothetical protein SAMN06269250_0132 [Spirosoma fluviale]